MGEQVNYSVTAKGLRSKQELEALLERIKGTSLGEPSDDANSLWDNEPTKAVWIMLSDGWRGGGNSCEDIAMDCLAPFSKLYPHVDFEVHAEMVEQAPVDTFEFKGKGLAKLKTEEPEMESR